MRYCIGSGPGEAFISGRYWSCGLSGSQSAVAAFVSVEENHSSSRTPDQRGFALEASSLAGCVGAKLSVGVGRRKAEDARVSWWRLVTPFACGCLAGDVRLQVVSASQSEYSS